jgi:hypothetical protein
MSTAGNQHQDPAAGHKPQRLPAGHMVHGRRGIGALGCDRPRTAGGQVVSMVGFWMLGL